MKGVNRPAGTEIVLNHFPAFENAGYCQLRRWRNEMGTPKTALPGLFRCRLLGACGQARHHNGSPADVLGTVTLSNVSNDSWNWYAIDLSSQNIFLNANSLYAIILSCPGSFYGIAAGGTVNDSYPGGMALVQSGAGTSWYAYTRAVDLTFETWMIPGEAVPEAYVSPSAWLVGGLLFVGVLVNREQRRRNPGS